MRTCFALDLKNDPELIAQYEHYHQPEHIWPEIPIGIRAGGIADMQIFRIGNHLCMFVETVDGVEPDEAFQQIGNLPNQPEWAAFMNQFQQRLPEANPDEHWAKMKLIFSLNDALGQ